MKMRLPAIALLFAALSSGQSRSGQGGLAVHIKAACELRNVRTALTENVTEDGWTRASGITTFLYLIRTDRLTGSGDIRLAFPALPPEAELSWTAQAGAAGRAVPSGPASRTTVAEVICFGAGSRSANSGETGVAVWKARWPSLEAGSEPVAVSPIITCR